MSLDVLGEKAMGLIRDMPKEQREPLEDIILEYSSRLQESKESLSKQKAESDERYRTLAAEFEEASNALRKALEESDENKSRLAVKTEEFRSVLDEIDSLRNAHSKVTAENQSLKSNVDSLRQEKLDMLSAMESRTGEIGFLKTEIEFLEQKLKISSKEKAELLTQNALLAGLERKFQSSETSWKGEREMLMGEIELLRKKITENVSNMLCREQEMKQQLSERDSSIAILEAEKKDLTDTVARIHTTVEEAEKRNKEFLDENEKLRSSLAGTQKEYEESVEQLRKSLDALRDERDNAVDICNKKSFELEQAKEEHSLALRDCEATVGLLQNELAEVKKVLGDSEKTIEQLTEELKSTRSLLLQATEDNQQNASGSDLLRTSVLSQNLSQVYTDYIKASEELALAKCENEKLKKSLDIVLQEIKEKTPVLVRQRLNYENAVERNAAMRQSIETMSKQVELMYAESSMKSRRFNSIARENEMLKQEVKDLASQVRALLRQKTEQSHQSESLYGNSRNLSSADVIDANLVTFESIEELQEKNQKLLATVRDLSTSRELAEEEVIREKTKEMSITVKHMAEKIEVLEQEMEIHKHTINALTTQRDAYRKLLDCGGNNQASRASDDEKMAVSEVRARTESVERAMIDTEQLMLRQKEQYEASVKRLSETVDRLESELEKQRSDCAEWRTQAAIAESKLLECNERIQTYCVSVKNLKGELSGWSNRYSELSKLNGKLQSTNAALNQSLLCMSEKCRLLETQNKSSECDLEFARARLEQAEKEKQILKESLECNKSLVDVADTLKEAIERSSRENRYMMETKIADLERAVKNAEEKLKREEKLKDLALSSCQLELEELRKTISTEREIYNATRDELKNEKLRIVELVGELSSAQSKLKSSEVFSQFTRSTPPVDENEKLSIAREENKELEIQNKLLSAELESERSLVAELRKSISQYKDVSVNFDDNLKSHVELFDSQLNELKSKLDKAESDNQEKQNLIEQYLAEIAELKQTIDRVEDEGRSMECEFRRKNQDQSNRLLEVMMELESTKAECARLSSNCSSMNVESQENVGKVAALQERLTSLENQLADRDLKLSSLESQLKELNDQKRSLIAEKESLALQTRLAEQKAESVNAEYTKALEENAQRITLQHAEIEKLASKLSGKYNSEGADQEEIDAKYLNILEANRLALKEKGALEEQLKNAKVQILKLENELAITGSGGILASSIERKVDSDSMEQLALMEKSLQEMKNCNQRLIEENQRLSLENQNLLCQADEKRKEYDALFTTAEDSSTMTQQQETWTDPKSEFGDLIQASRLALDSLTGDNEQISIVRKLVDMVEAKLLQQQRSSAAQSMSDQRSSMGEGAESAIGKRPQSPEEQRPESKRLKTAEQASMNQPAEFSDSASEASSAKHRIQPIVWQEGIGSVSHSEYHSESAPTRVVARGLRRGRALGRDHYGGHYRGGLGRPRNR